MKKLLFFLFFISISVHTEARVFTQPCEEIQFVGQKTNSDIEVHCQKDYQLYKHKIHQNYDKNLAINLEELKVASFNVLHPGMSKTRYKDYKILGKIINQWDLVAVQELIPSTGLDLDNNKDILKNYDKNNDLISHYKFPGYIKILQELQKHDSSWSLLMSSTAEGSIDSDVMEYSGFFYKAKIVKPIVTPYCRKLTKTIQSFACLPTLEDLDDENKLVFSRRPFMASFKFGQNQLTILNSHVVYTAPTNTHQVSYINGKLPAELQGLNKENFARIAEVKLTLDFMKKLEDKKLSSPLVYLGDFNLEKKLDAWELLLNPLLGYEIYNDQLTSLTTARITNNIETFGLSQNYDHFIFNQQKAKCHNINVFNFMTETSLFKEELFPFLMYGLSPDEINQKQKNLIQQYILPIQNGERKFTRVKRGKIIEDVISREKYVQEFERRLIQSQLTDASFYSIYKELISDHLPIYMNCSSR